MTNTFTKDNIEALNKNCTNIVLLLNENIDGPLTYYQLAMLGENISNFLQNPIITNSGLLNKKNHEQKNDIPAKEDLPGESTWFQVQDEHGGRKKSFSRQKSKRKKSTFSLKKELKTTEYVVFSSFLW